MTLSCPRCHTAFVVTRGRAQTTAAATLTLDGHVLDFGEISVTGPQCYVRVDGGWH
jgi:hypothetical protein